MNALDLRVTSDQTVCSLDHPVDDIVKSARPQITSDTILPVKALPGVICDKKFPEVKEKTDLSARSIKCQFNDEIGTEESRNVCEICNKRFRDASNLQEHHRCHASEERSFVHVKNGKVYDSDILNSQESLLANAPQHSCGKCDKSFTDMRQLQSHELIHIGTRPFMCDMCNRRFTQAGHLRRHELSHTGDCPFVCKTCDLRFTLEKNLRKHELKHDRERPFACESCEEKFTEEVLLRTHELSHVVQRTYVCETCCKSFTQAGSLRRHERIHSGQQPYICGNCNKRFTREENLTRHMFLHTGERPFVCATCNATFAQAGTLQRHERRHCGERTFDCKKCDKKCYGLSALRAHQYAHTREENLSGVSLVPREKQSDKIRRDKDGRIWRRPLRSCPNEYPDHHHAGSTRNENAKEYSSECMEEQISDLIRSQYDSLSSNYRRRMDEDISYDEEEQEEEEQKYGCGLCGEMFITRPHAKSCFYQHCPPHTSDSVSALDEDRTADNVSALDEDRTADNVSALDEDRTDLIDSLE